MVLNSDFPWKIGHIAKSHENLSIFPIPNFLPRYSVKRFMLDWEPSLKRWQFSSFPEKLFQDIIGAYQWGAGSQFPVERSYLCFIRSRYQMSDITRPFHIFSIYRIKKSRDFQCRGCILSRFPQFQNPLSRYPDIPFKKVANLASQGLLGASTMQK